MHLSKSIEIYTNTNCGLHFKVMYQYRFISCNKWATLRQDSHRGEYLCVAGADCMETLYLLLTFSIKLKLLFKKKTVKTHIVKSVVF